jgi:hypothetical protein
LGIGAGDWGLGLGAGDLGLGTGDWGLGAGGWGLADASGDSCVSRAFLCRPLICLVVGGVNGA